MSHAQPPKLPSRSPSSPACNFDEVPRERPQATPYCYIGPLGTQRLEVGRRH